MFEATVGIDLDILIAIREACQSAPGLMNTVFARNMRRLRRRILDELQDEPPVWKGRRRWKSRKQQRAYFASDGFGKGIPYVRSHGLSKAWEVEVAPLDDGGELIVRNDNDAMPFVQGDWAQPMHLDSKWPQVGIVVSNARAEAEDVAIESWGTVVLPYAGVPQLPD